MNEIKIYKALRKKCTRKPIEWSDVDSAEVKAKGSGFNLWTDLMVMNDRDLFFNFDEIGDDAILANFGDLDYAIPQIFIYQRNEGTRYLVFTEGYNYMRYMARIV